MKKENRKAAQERRARERQAEERKKKLVHILVPVIVIAALAVLVIGIVVTATQSTDDSVKTSDSAYDSTGSVTSGSDTNAVTSSDVSSESVVSGSSRTAKMGDTVVIDYVGKIDGVAFDGGTAENQTLVLGSGTYIDGFEDQIAGHHVGETFDINVTFPDDYGAADLAGKDAVFTITLDSVQ